MIMGLKYPQTIEQTKHPSSYCSVCLYCFQAQEKELLLLKKNCVLKTGNERKYFKSLRKSPLERKYLFLLPDREIFVISKYLILSYRPYQFYFYLQFKFVWHKESIFVTIIANLSLYQGVFPSCLSKEKSLSSFTETCFYFFHGTASLLSLM